MRAFVIMDYIYGGEGRYLKMKMKARIGVFNKTFLFCIKCQMFVTESQEVNPVIHSGSPVLRRLSCTSVITHAVL